MSLAEAEAHWNAGRNAEALAAAWRAFDTAPRGMDERRLLTRILSKHPDGPNVGRGDDLRALVEDSEIEPSTVTSAGWIHLRTEAKLFARPDDPRTLAPRLENNALALALLSQDITNDQFAEMALTPVRRWLLEENRWRDFPRLAQAMIAQASINGGAWLFSVEERALLDGAGEFAEAYLPPREAASRAVYADPVTRAVAEQYEGWPYPQWRRLTRPEPSTLAKRVRRVDPEGPDTVPARGAEILIAGCGTGRQVAAAALRYPHDRITAIDISRASLRYAERRCAEAGVTGVTFQALDLHRVAEFGRRFDAVFCAGVLHHLPDPEAGWAALADVLKPGGIMHVMVYSKLCRMRVQGLRRHLTDLKGQAISDDLLREVRRRLLAEQNLPPLRSHDFYSLAGVHDLLMHPHEDPFDVPRIQRVLAALDLQLVRFGIPNNALCASYLAEHPDDPLQRDFECWNRLDRSNPLLYAQMFDLWCRRP
jgi:SAM-dependent methyltransferase